MEVDQSEESNSVSIVAFGHEFQDLDPEQAQELITLEKEGAVYETFWDTSIDSFRFCRIRLLPAEIVEFVESALAQQEFSRAMKQGARLEEALDVITDRRIAARVWSYGDYGHTRQRDGSEVDIRGCQASFMSSELETLLTGQLWHRYEPVPNLGDSHDRVGLIAGIVNAFPVVARYMQERGQNRPPFTIETEYDVQDLL